MLTAEKPFFILDSHQQKIYWVDLSVLLPADFSSSNLGKYIGWFSSVSQNSMVAALLLPRGFSRNQYIWAVMTMVGGSCGRKNGQNSI